MHYCLLSHDGANTVRSTRSLHSPREDQSVASRYQRAQLNDEVDARYGFERYSLPAERTGWLINMHPVRLGTLIMSLLACWMNYTCMYTRTYMYTCISKVLYLVHGQAGVHTHRRAYTPQHTHTHKDAYISTQVHY